MNKQSPIKIKVIKQRLTAFVDPILIKRAKVRGALEGLTVSEVVEKALDEYAPLIEKDSEERINLKFLKTPLLDSLTVRSGLQGIRIAPKHIRQRVVPR